MPQHQITLRSPTGRLTLAPPSAEYDEQHARIRSHPMTRKYQPQLPETCSTEDARAMRENRAAAGVLSFFVHMNNPDGSTTFVGTCGLHSISEEDQSAGVGVGIAPDYHRGGVGTEALYTVLQFGFEDRQFHRIVFETGAENEGMKGWLEKVAGVQQEFRMRKRWKTQSGGYMDVVGYALFQDEWANTIKARLQSRLQKEG